MGQPADPAAWAEHEFGGTSLGDARLTRRLTASAERLARRPSGSLPQRFDWNELRGFYRLAHSRHATPANLQAAHARRTRERMHRPDPVLIIHDTTELDYTSHPALHPHLGPIGDGNGRGILQHNSIACAPETQEILGLAYQQMELRRPAPEGETRGQLQRRVVKESHLWADGFAGVGAAPEGVLWVDVCDAGADFFDAMERALALGHHFLIRACQDRCVETAGEDGVGPGYLMTLARGLPAEQFGAVEVSAKGGRPARSARVALASRRVTIRPPARGPKGRLPIEATVIRVWEIDPPAGEAPLEWVLVTSLPAETSSQVRLYRDWYALRWRVAEEYHKVEKTGCGEEDLRFETLPPLLAALAILSVVAVRVLSLRWARDGRGDEGAEAVASPIEVEVVKKATGYRGRSMSVRQFVDAVAKLGGYLGRKGDGPPGWRTLWRGWQRLADMIAGIELIREGASPDPPEEAPPD